MKFLAVFVLLLGLVSLVFYFQKGNDGLQTSPATQPTSQQVQPEDRTFKLSKGDNPPIRFDLAQGFLIHVFASGLTGPRDLEFSPSGTLFVSQPATNSVVALPDRDGNGVADTVKTVVSGLGHAHGIVFHNGKLYVAGEKQVNRYSWDESSLSASIEKKLFSLPANSDHNNRTLVFDKKGNLYISLGSTCNVCRESPLKGGSILVSNEGGEPPKVLATGLRNAAFLAFSPLTGQLYATEMGRDYLGDNSPPDELNIIQENQDYGWPNCYGDKIPDLTFNKSADCSKSTSPIYKFDAHSAPLGLVFITSSQFPASWQNDLLVALHGSWNRSKAVGYKIVHLSLKNGKVTNFSDFLTGFNPGDQKDDSLGRPVDMAFDKLGNLYVSDDKAGSIYVIQKAN